jgi:formylmethanofuran dehydrogenase subunit E
VALQDYVIEMEAFHGGRSPGMLVGAVLLDAAMARMKNTRELGVVAETINCLPDAVQLLTPCTVGNGWLRIFNRSKFAITQKPLSSTAGLQMIIPKKPGCVPNAGNPIPCPGVTGVRHARGWPIIP